MSNKQKLPLTREQILEIAPTEPTLDWSGKGRIENDYIDMEWRFGSEEGKPPDQMLEIFIENIDRRFEPEEAWDRDGKLWYLLTDWGSGGDPFEDGEVIGEEHLKELFERFFRNEE